MIMTWTDFFKQEEAKDYYKKLNRFLDEQYAADTIYPPREDLFSCFNLTPYDAVKVVILGQDPYHQPGQAHGLSFSVRKGVKIPPSLRNIYKELNSDLGIAPAAHGFLEDWAKQGVFLLNAVLTVAHDRAGSHRKQGWESFSDNVIELLNAHPQPLVFILWGAWAQGKEELITNSKHLIIKSAHPSPLSAKGFFGSKPFSQANAFFKANGIAEIDWKLSE
jgi:uracil-DNA glycosylase